MSRFTPSIASPSDTTPLASPRPRPRPRVRRSLWKAGIAAAVFLLTLLIGNHFLSPGRAVSERMLGHDFLAFYTAGSFIRLGRTADLYDLQAVNAYQAQLIRQHKLEELGEGFGPWWNPPFYAWVFAPLSALPYPQALLVWVGVSWGALLAAVVLLCRMLPAGSDWRTWGLVPLLLGVSMPLLQAATHGQNTFTSLLLLSVVVTLWRSDRGLLAGLAAGLLFYKPQLAAVVAGMLVLTLGWRALAGLAISGSSLLAATLWTMPGALTDWLTKLPANLRFMQVENVYLWERHVTLKAFWRLLLQGRGAGEASGWVTGLALLCMVALGAGLGVALWRRRGRRGGTLDGLVAATVASMPLLMPFYFDYDLLLLAVPAVLLAGHWSAEHRLDRWLLGAWAVMFLWLPFNPAVAAACRVNVTVVLLAALAGMLVVRACRRNVGPPAA